jgi:DNA-binding MarR family transcriptional regulator
MKGYPSEAVQRAWVQLVRAQQRAVASIEQALRKAKLPPLAWYDALLELERAGGSMRPFELERVTLVAQYNLSRLIDRLEKAGYVERRVYANDRRGQVIAITRAGKAIRRRTWSVFGPAIQAAVGARLSPKQIDTLNALLGPLAGMAADSPISRSPDSA